MKNHLKHYAKAVARSHASLAEHLTKHADGLPDDHEHREAIHKLAEHHAEMGEHALTLVEGLEADSGKAAGLAGRFSEEDLVPTRARAVFETEPPTAGLKLIGRAGGPPIEKAKVSSEMEDALGGL